jgi:hypothetical protein
MVAVSKETESIGAKMGRFIGMYVDCAAGGDKLMPGR